MVQTLDMTRLRRKFQLDTTDSAPLHLCVTSNIRDFAQFWPRSDQLGSARCYAFQCSDLLEVQCETFAVAGNLTPRFVAILGKGNAPQLLLPLCIEGRANGRINILKFMPGGLFGYLGPILFPPVADWNEKMVHLVWNGLRHLLPRFDVAVFEKMPVKVGDLINPFNLLQTTQCDVSGHAATLLGSWGDFSAKLPGRRNLRRLRRRLGERGVVTFDLAKTPEQYDKFIVVLIQQKGERYGDSRVFEYPGYLEYLSAARRLVYPTGPVCLFTLGVGDEIIASTLGYAVGSRFIGHLCSIDNRWRQYSPGRLLFENILEWCFANKLDIFDFGTGDAEYKHDYCDTTISLREAVIPTTARGFAASLWRNARNSMKDCVGDFKDICTIRKSARTDKDDIGVTGRLLTLGRSSEQSRVSTSYRRNGAAVVDVSKSSSDASVERLRTSGSTSEENASVSMASGSRTRR